MMSLGTVLCQRRMTLFQQLQRPVNGGLTIDLQAGFCALVLIDRHPTIILATAWCNHWSPRLELQRFLVNPRRVRVDPGACVFNRGGLILRGRESVGGLGK